MEGKKNENKKLSQWSLVAAGVMAYLMFSGLDEGFLPFPWELFAALEWCLGLSEGLKLVEDVKRKEFEEWKKQSSIYRPVTFLVWIGGNVYWLVWPNLFRQFIRVVPGLDLYDFRRFPYGNGSGWRGISWLWLKLKLSKKIKDKESWNISFEINDRCVALIGLTGAGKTTLIDCLGRQVHELQVRSPFRICQ